MITKPFIVARSITRLVLLVIVVTIIFVGCDLLGGVSVGERISDFVSDLANRRYGSMSSHIHPNVAGRNLMNSDYWSTAFHPNQPISEIGRSGSGNNRTVTVSTNLGNRWLVFGMRESGGDSYVNTLTYSEVGGANPVQLSPPPSP